MASDRNGISMGPYTRKQKLYLETEDGTAMEGEFVKFNPSQTTVLLRHVELIPSDGRTFEQYNAVLSELVCLRPLEAPAIAVNMVTNCAVERPESVPETTNDFVLPERDNSEEAKQQKAEKFAAKKSLLQQRLIASGLIKDPMIEPLTLEAPVPTCKSKVVENPSLEKTRETAKSSKPKIVKNNDKCPEKVDQQPQVNSEKPSSEPTVTNGIYEALKLKAKGYIIIDKPGPLLKSALEDIEKRTTIGLGSHGADRGRLNRLSLLTVATESSVYLFDIQALGKQALQSPLIKALESSAIEKVTYDCRYLSDCLYYSHQIRMQNVYDVQAADCVMHRCRKGSFPNRGRSLQEIVSHYLDLPAALLANKTDITNYKVWYQRPLEDNCFDFAAWQVVPLTKLRVAIDKVFQNLMVNSFDVYLNQIRKLHRSDAVETQSSRRQIPVALLDAPFTRDA